MKKATLFLTTFLLYGTSLFGQPEFWQISFPNGTGTFNSKGTLIEKDRTFVSVIGKTFYENTYFLEAETRFTLPFEGSSFQGAYFYATEIENNGDPFYFAAQRNGNEEGPMHLNTFNSTDELTTGFVVNDNLGDHSLKGPSAVQVNDQTVLIFGNQFFHKINIAGDGSMSLEWSYPAGYGLIADARPYNGGYILCNEAGMLVYVNGETEEVWSKNLDDELRSVLVLNDGFLLAGNEEEFAVIVKTDFDGEVIWEKQYGEGEAMALDFSHENGYVVTGRKNGLIWLANIDENGDLNWERNFDNGSGVDILKSQYGGYFVQSKYTVISHILRLDDHGEIEEVLNNAPSKVIEANNIRSSATAYGQLFWDGDDTNTTFPEDSLTPTIFAGGLWLAGLDQTGELYTSVAGYLQTDFLPGPIGANSSDWDNVWRINRKFIDRMRNDLIDGDLDRPIPLDYWTYPGTGNPHFNINGGQGAVPENMAPFIDVNNDGIYNILDGDYPDLKGDEMLWWVMNDNNAGSMMGGSSFGFEYKCVYYAYSCDGSDVLYNTAFLEFDITNHSDKTYSDLHLGAFIDIDLGCFTDDYFGTLENTNSVFAYNEDNTDGNGLDCYGVPPFETGEIPIQSITLLNKDLTSVMYYNNGGVNPPPPPGTADPGTQEHIYNLLRSTWPDGTPLTYGGTGYGGTTPTNVIFPGNPAEVNDWTMCSENILSGDKRIVPGSGPYILDTDEIIELDWALTAHENIDYPCPDITQVESEILELQVIYNNGTLDYMLDLGPDQDYTQGEIIILDAGSGALSYEWSTGATTQTIEVSTPGIYSVTVTTPAGCEYTDEVNIGGVTGVSDLLVEAPKVYPNPTSGQLFIQFGESLPSSASVETISGKRLQAFKLENLVANSTFELNLPVNQSGIYLLRFYYPDGRQSLQRVVLIR